MGEGDFFNLHAVSFTRTLTSPMLRMGPHPLPLKRLGYKPLRRRGLMSDVSTPKHSNGEENAVCQAFSSAVTSAVETTSAKVSIMLFSVLLCSKSVWVAVASETNSTL